MKSLKQISHPEEVKGSDPEHTWIFFMKSYFDHKFLYGNVQHEGDIMQTSV